MKLGIFAFFLIILTCSFATGEKETTVVDLKIPKAIFSKTLEWEIYTQGEQFIHVIIKHESGKVIYNVERYLYGESYNELDASEFPKGKYKIEVICGKQSVSGETIKS